MASSSKDEDLLPEQTEGFKVGEKKTMDEYHKLGMLYSLS
jgi:Rho GDP-dissociation inhibitor